MAASDHLGPQWYHGHLPASSLVRTEWHPEHSDYQHALEDHIRSNEGEIPGELTIHYKRAGEAIADEHGRAFWVNNGHHRLTAAEHLGISHVPVKVKSHYGPPPGLDMPERDEWGEV